ncbi:MAG: universal stress protein [Bacteroidetes bacterium]|nr:MAG: universal stress protein [Bacteroidota bacterium]
MKPIQTILVPTDLSEDAMDLLALAIDLARRHGAAVQVMYIRRALEDDAWSPLRLSPEQAVLRESPENMLRDLIDRQLRGLRTDEVQITVDAPHSHSVSAGILRQARASEADLIVMGLSGRRGQTRRRPGHTVLAVVREAPCPVLTVPPGFPPGAAFERIVVVADPAEAHEPAVTLAQALATAYGARLAVPHPAEDAPVADRYGAGPEAWREVARTQETDLLVVHLPDASGDDPTTVIASLLSEASCPVLIVGPAVQPHAAPAGSSVARDAAGTASG